jgi:G3E family GTPase
LQSALRRLLTERDEKSVERVVIQTSHDLGPILRTFTGERALGSECFVEETPPLEGKRFTLTEDTPLAWDAFSRFATTLTALRGPDLLQMSGLLNIEGCRGPVAVQFMGHLAARPVELQIWPEGARANRLEFVTRNIAERTVRDLFDATRALA